MSGTNATSGSVMAPTVEQIQQDRITQVRPGKTFIYTLKIN